MKEPLANEPFNNKAKRIHQISVDKGWWNNTNVNTKLLLIITEIGEAVEALRESKHSNIVEMDKAFFVSPSEYKKGFEKFLKDTFEQELIDTLIRLLDLCYSMGINIDKHLKYGIDYNSLRPFKHGDKKF